MYASNRKANTRGDANLKHVMRPCSRQAVRSLVDMPSLTHLALAPLQSQRYASQVTSACCKFISANGCMVDLTAVWLTNM